MAEQLKRQYALFSIKLELDAGREGAEVLVTPETCADGKLTRLDALKLPAHAFGIPERIPSREARGAGHTFTVPPQLLGVLSSALQQREAAEDPVWLHLAGPAGYLRFVPWEELLQPKLGVPLLRLPEFLVGAPKRKRQLRCVLCASMPRAKSEFEIPAILERTIDRLLTALPDKFVFDVFTDAELFSEVRNRFERRGWLNGGPVTQHDPERTANLEIPEATRKVSEESGRLESPWLVWIRQVLRGKSADIVHFLGHGFYSEQAAAVSFSESPLVNADQRIARFVGAQEIVTLCTQIGAWGVTLASPPENYSRMGLRGLAHTVAQLRPGPVVHHEYQLDPQLDALGRTYEFLFGNGRPPETPAIILYCHPARVSEVGWQATRAFNNLSDELESRMDAICDHDASLTLDTPDEAPAWAAVASRYVEQRALHLKHVAGSGPSVNRALPREANATGETLLRIQDVIAKALKNPRGTL